MSHSRSGPAPAPLVAEPEAVDESWLTDALHRSGAAPTSASVASFTTERIGTGQVGQNIRFSLVWEPSSSSNDPAAPSPPGSVVGKFASPDPASRQAGLMTGTYVREVAFYRSLAGRCRMRIPACHVAELDPATGEFVLLFEDMAGATQGDQIEGCGADRAEIAMIELGRLHAGFTGEPPTDWLVARAGDAASALTMMYQGLTATFAAHFGDDLAPGTVEMVEAFGPVVSGWLATDRHPDLGGASPLTVLHTDYRLDNMLFGADGDAPPLTVVDWQTPALGAGVSDAAYFLATSLSIEDRRAHERALVSTYLEALSAEGVALDPDAAWQTYRANVGAALHMTVMASVIVGHNDRGDAMFRAMADRAAAAMTDLETVSLLAGLD